MILNLGGSTLHASHFQFYILRQKRSRMVIQTPTTQKSLSCNGVENHSTNVVQNFGSVIVLPSFKGSFRSRESGSRMRCLASRCPYIFKYWNRLSVPNFKFGHHHS
jgi:hypothetical protein